MTFQLIDTQENAHDDSIWSVAWGKRETDGVEHIITGSLDDTVKAWKWDKDNLDLQYIFEGHSLGVVSVDINKNGNIVASNSLDSHIRLWNLDSGEQVQSIDGGPVNAWTVVFAPNSEYLATCAQSGKIFLHGTNNAEKKYENKELDPQGKFTMCIAISQDSKQIAGGSIDGIIRLYDVETGKIPATVEGHAMPIRSLAFSPDSKYLISGSDDCHIKIYDVNTGELLSTLSGHGSSVLSVAFSPTNKLFASSSSDRTVKVWDIDTKKCIHTFNNHKDQVWGVKFNPSGSGIVSVSEDKSICIYSCA